jgi:hypothetical protein
MKAKFLRTVFAEQRAVGSLKFTAANTYMKPWEALKPIV